jgi:hypothetical protein
VSKLNQRYAQGAATQFCVELRRMWRELFKFCIWSLDWGLVGVRAVRVESEGAQHQSSGPRTEDRRMVQKVYEVTYC